MNNSIHDWEMYEEIIKKINEERLLEYDEIYIYRES